MNAISITVDIEDWYHIPSVTGSPFSVYKDVNEFFKRWTGRYDYLTEPTKRMLDMLDEFDINATFFVVADVVDNYLDLVESIVERGHEIGCHGLHQKLTFVNFIDTDGHRLTQMGNYKRLINFGYSALLCSVTIKRRVMDKKKIKQCKSGSKQFGIFKPRLKDWLRDPAYIFWLGT